VAVQATPSSQRLRPFLPRVVIDWLRTEPDSSYRLVEGTLAFVDISGFTRMTERLARRGKAGAEELVEILDGTFTALLRVAYADGAGLVKWGGDAVLLLFTGDGHAERACRATHGMQQTLRHVGRIATSAGPVTLRMSVGVHSGTFHFFLVGDVHRELIVAGPGVTTTVEMEAAADAGEILLSPQTAAILDARHTGAIKGDGVLLRTPPETAFQPAAPVGSVDDLDLTACIPLELREVLHSGSLEPEHRAASIGFVEFMGTDDLLAREGAAAVAAAIGDIVTLAEEAARRHEISFHESDIARNGGRILLVAGAPRSTGADEERCLLAVRAVAAYEGPLGVRCGVNRGHIFAGLLGPPYRRTFSIKGDAVNLAARLMGKAAPGQVLTTAAVLDRSRTPFQTTALPPFMVKGKAKPVEAFAVGAQERAAAAPEADAGPLIGRELEMATLTQLLEAARAGGGGVVEIVGEPGIGKSRLTEEMRVRATGFHRHDIRCEAYEATTPYFAIRGFLRSVLGVTDEPGLRARVAATAPELLRWLPLLGIAVGIEVAETPATSELEERARRERLERATSSLVVRVLQAPVLLCVEDAHWMDEASGEVLRQLVRRGARAGWAFCVTRRPVETGVAASSWPETTVLEPGPLAEEAAAAFVGTEGLGLAPHEIAALTRRAGGNPLFLRELVAAARTSGAVDGLPDSVEAVIAAQIDRLPVDDRALLRYASVIGQSFGEPMAQAILTPDHIVPRWESLGEFLVVERPGSWRFRHALIRDAAYEGLSFRRRRLLHGRVGDVIRGDAGADEDAHAELLSLHFFEAQRFADAWRYSRVAGDRARSKWANAEAAEFYGRALDAARALHDVAPADVASAAEALGDVHERLGKFPAATSAYTRARRLSRGDRMATARLLMKQGIIREHSGRYPEALRWYSRALAIDREGEPVPERAELMIAYGGVRFRQGRYRAAIEWCEAAVEHAERVGDRAALAHAYQVLHLVHITIRSPERARYRDLALPIYEELGDVLRQGYVLNNLAMDAYYEGQWDDAIRLHERCREALQRAGAWVEAADVETNIAEILSDQGHHEEAERLLRAGLVAHHAAGYPMGIAFALQNLGRALARMGRTAEAREVLEDALERWKAIGDEVNIVETEARLIQAMLYDHEPTTVAFAEDVLTRSERVELPPSLEALLARLHGYALAQAGDGAGAVAEVERSIARARAAGVTYELALGLDALARVAPERPDRADLLRESADLLARLGVVTFSRVPVSASR
jgi:class 3 adenylate cyclase/tetratricopeptide (TPR) repeat protein